MWNSLSRGNDIIPLIGARRRNRLEEALGAINLQLIPFHKNLDTNTGV
ncbi:hypothetical protein ACE1AT_16750 [Pelatocladus sp. BLCC-F211]